MISLSTMHLDNSSTGANTKAATDAKKARFEGDKVDRTHFTSWVSGIVDI